MLNISARQRDLIVTIGGRAVSTFGDGVAVTALILRLQAGGGEPYQVGLLMAAGGLPQLALAGWVGRLVDRRDSRALLVGGGLIQVAVTSALVFARAAVPLLLLVAALGAATAVTSTTWAALLPRVAGEGRIAQAVSTQQALAALVMVAGPAVGGLLTSALGAGVPLIVDAATFGVAAAAGGLVRARRRPEPATEAECPGRSGFARLRADRVLSDLLAGVALVILLVGMVDVVLVYLVRDRFHAAGIWFGTTEAAWLAGMVAGSFGAGRIRSEPRRVRATVAGAAVACAGVAGYAAAPSVGWLVPLSLLGGCGNGYAATSLSTLLMTRTPDAARGRVSAAAAVVLGGAQGAALLAGSLVAAVLSPRAIYATAGLLGLAASALVGQARRHRREAGEPEQPEQPVARPPSVQMLTSSR